MRRPLPPHPYPYLALAAALGGLAACAHSEPEGTGGYRPAPVEEAQRLDGKVLVVVDPDSDRLLGPGPPPQVDRDTLVALAVALVAREDAARLFGEHFRGPVQVKPAEPTAGGARVVVEPVARSQPGGGVNTVISLSVAVSLLGDGGKATWSRSYDSGLMQGQTYFPRGAGGQRLGQAAHRTIERLLERAVTDVRAEIEKAGPAPR